jgi:hypothetical protein
MSGLLGHPERRADLLPRPALRAGSPDLYGLGLFGNPPQLGYGGQPGGNIGALGDSHQVRFGAR